MIPYWILFPLLASFFITLILIPVWIKKAHSIRLVWPDMNKLSSKKVAGSGGIIVILGFTIGVFTYIAFRVFILKDSDGILVNTFAMLTAILILSGIGLIDDLLGWQKGGLRRRVRILLVALAALPLMAINAGRSEMLFPLFGVVDLGILYALVIIPIGIIGATTTFNFLAGYNGLEASQGILLLASFGAIAYFTGNSWLSVIALCMIASLLAFLLFNMNPATVFPGDSMTYAIGGLLASLAILGNFEKIAVILFIPYGIEVILKARGKLSKQSFGLPQKDGSLKLRYGKIYGLEHAAIYTLSKLKIKPTETKVVISILLFQLAFIVATLIIFREGIFLIR